MKVEARYVLPREQRQSRKSLAEEKCRITVEDNGIGFDQQYAERIFGIFQRLHPRDEYEGTGIGLAICRRIVEYHGGQISAQGTPGKGSTFEVLLPVAQVEKETQRGRLMENQARARTILMADDDADDCLLVQAALRETKQPHDLRIVRDGQQLLDYLRRRGEYRQPPDVPRPDLILLDLKMPRKDGREALGELKADPRLRSIPIVVFTTSTARDDIGFLLPHGRELLHHQAGHLPWHGRSA